MSHGPGKRPSELLQAVLETIESCEIERQKMREADNYYEGEQLTQDVLDRRKEIGLPSPTVTLVTEAVNSVTGQEIKRRTDTQVVGNTNADTDMAEAINFLLRQQEDVADATIIDSEAYEEAVIAGVSWVFIGKSSNPLRPGVEIKNVDRENVITDRRSRERDGSDCEWRCWREFMVADEAKMMLPAHKDLIDQVAGGTLQHSPIVSQGYTDTYLGSQYQSQFYRGDKKNAEIALYCIWYRDYEKRVLITRGDDVQIYDENSIEHVTLLADMNALIEHVHVPVMKEAWFVGPFLAIDDDSPHPHNEFPLIESRGYMRRRDKRRYGLIEHAIGPQDEYNLLCTKIAEILVSTRIMWEAGALGIGPEALTVEQVRDEFARRDTMLELEHNGLSKIQVEKDWQELQYLVQLKESAREQVRIAMGVNYAFTGQVEGEQSGTAIASLAELSAAVMGKINSNYEAFRKQRAWLQIAHIIDQIGSKEHVVEIEDDNGGPVKTVTLNQRSFGGITNKLSLAKVRIRLKHISTSQGYKAFNHQRMTEMHNNTQDEALQRALTPALIKTSDVPEADQILEDYKKNIGQSEDPAAQKQAQEQQQLQETLQKLEIAEREAEINLKNAQAEKARADANASKQPEKASGQGREDKIKQLRQLTASRQLSQQPGRTLQ